MIRKITNDIFYVGAVDWDRRLFDELIPLPDGTSYNAYLIKGSEKTALIDTVDPTMTEVLIENLKNLNVKSIDYVISHHAEQDHSGAIPKILELYPEAKVITSSKCRGMLIDLLHINKDRFATVDDGDILSLGNKTLKFIFAPWVHWPETILTYLEENKILFPCDLFGSHLATSELYAENTPKIYESAKRYYAEIMMPFRKHIVNHLKKLESFDIKMIAPSHGPIYKNPDFIINAYKDWVDDKVKNEAVLPYVSMHGSVSKMVDYFISALIERGIIVKPFNLTKTDIGELAIALVDAATIVVASPTVLGGAHPAAIYAVYLANALRPKLKFAALIGSYGWGGKMPAQITQMMENLDVEALGSVIIKGCPKKDDFISLSELSDKILEKHSAINLL